MTSSRMIHASLIFLSLVLGISNAAKPNVAGSHSTRPDLSTSATSASLPTKFSDNEQLEQNLVWRVIKKSCSGCWSGALRTYSVNKKKLVLGNPIQKKKKNPPDLLNFRLRVDIDGNVGTWSLWNLERKGDYTVVPLRQTPLIRTPQLKIGFYTGIILRISGDVVGSKLKRLGWEIGFWDPSSMRRTTVVQYKRPFLMKWRPGWHLDDIVVIQMKPERMQHFVGNTTDPEMARLLPKAAPFRLSDCNLGSFKVHHIESVDLQTMKRSTTILGASDHHSITERIANAFNDQYNVKERMVRTVLPNEMLVSLPTSIGGRRDKSKSDPITAMFALCLNERKLQVVELTYDATAAKAMAVSLYSLRR